MRLGPTWVAPPQAETRPPNRCCRAMLSALVLCHCCQHCHYQLSNQVVSNPNPTSDPFIKSYQISIRTPHHYFVLLAADCTSRERHEYPNPNVGRPGHSKCNDSPWKSCVYNAQPTESENHITNNTISEKPIYSNTRSISHIPHIMQTPRSPTATNNNIPPNGLQPSTLRTLRTQRSSG